LSGDPEHQQRQTEAEVAGGRLRVGLPGAVVPYGTLDGQSGGVAGGEGAENSFLWQASGLVKLPPGYAANNMQLMAPKYTVWTTPEDVSLSCITHCGPVVPMSSRMQSHREFLHMAMAGGLQGQGGAPAAALVSLAGGTDGDSDSIGTRIRLLTEGGIDLDGDGLVDVLGSASRSGPSISAPGMQMFKDDAEADLADMRMADGAPVLLEFCKRNDLEAARTFMEMGARVDAPSRPLRYTILQLMLAVRPDFGASEAELRSARARPDYRETTTDDQTKMIQLLFDFGADPNHANVLGHISAHTAIAHQSSMAPEVHAMQ